MSLYSVFIGYGANSEQGKGKGVSYDPKADKKLTLYIAKEFPKWQNNLIELVRENLEGLTLDVKKIMPKASLP